MGQLGMSEDKRMRVLSWYNVPLYTMKGLITFFTALLAAGVSTVTADTPPIPNLPPSLIPLYHDLYDRCEAAGKNSYVGVFYAGNTGYKTFNHGECYSYEVNGDLAQMAVFCKSVTCVDNPNPDCTGGATPPVGVPVPQFLTLINAADWVQLLGQGATCQPNGLPV